MSRVERVSEKYTPQHHKAAEFWRINGRDNTLTGQQFSVTPTTVARWRDAEDWKPWANMKDQAEAAELAMISLDAATRHTQETDALLAETRALLKQKLIDVRARASEKCSIEEAEYRTIGILLDICISGGVKKYGGAPSKVEVTTNDTDINAVKARLAEVGLISSVNQPGGMA